MTTEVSTIIIKTNKGPIEFNLWEVVSSEKYGSLRDAFYMNSDAAIILFSLQSRISYKNLHIHYKDFKTVCDNAPIILCGTGFDQTDEIKMKPRLITFPAKKNIPYYSTSSRTRTNLHQPLLDIARKLTGDDDIYFMIADEIEDEENENNSKIEEMIKEFDDQISENSIRG